MKRPAPAIGSHSLICLTFEAGELRSVGHCGVRRAVCAYVPSRGVLEAVRLSIALPDALAGQACGERGLPEMRRLIEGVPLCPVCASEVLPTTFNRRTLAVGTSRDHCQGGGGNAEAPPAQKKYWHRRGRQAPEGGGP